MGVFTLESYAQSPADPGADVKAELAAVQQESIESESGTPGSGAPDSDIASGDLEAGGEGTAEALPSGREQLIEEWNRPGRSLQGRITATRSTLVDLGMVGFPSAARLLISDETLGQALTRAEGAVALAPRLPDAHAFHAEVLFDQKDPIGFIRAALQGLRATFADLEGAHWFFAHLWSWLALTLGLGAGWYLVVCGAASIPRTAILFSGPSRAFPLPSGVAALLCVVLFPAVLGMGLFGVVLVLAGLALIPASGIQRFTVAVASAATVFGAFPALDRSMELFSRPGGDPVAEAAYASDWETASLMDLSRLRGAESDPLAKRGLATWERRRGLHAQALNRYDGLLGAQADAGALNNAAVLRLAGGDSEGAISLFERAAKQSRSTAVLVNLSEAYGRTIRLDEQNLAMAEAQLLDPHAVKELTRSGKSTVLRDIGISAETVNQRLVEAPHTRSAAFLRRGLAPAWMAERWIFLMSALVGLALLALAAGRWLPETHTLSERLDLSLEERGATTDPFERIREVTQVRERKVRLRWCGLLFAGLLPGAAGVIARRPIAGLVAALCFAAAISSWWMRDGLFSDPMSAGLLWHGTAVAITGLSAAGLLWATVMPLTAIWKE